jgi:hypothetical protein
VGFVSSKNMPTISSSGTRSDCPEDVYGFQTLVSAGVDEESPCARGTNG